MPLGVVGRTAVPAGATAAVLLILALNGGSFDIVARQQLAILVWVVIGAGWAVGVLPRAVPSRPMLAAIAGMALLCIVCAVSLAWTESPQRTVEDLARDTLYLGVIVLTVSLVDRQTVPKVLLGCLAGGAVVLLVAFASRLSPSLFPTNDVRRIFETPRLSYPLNYWNALGAYAAMLMGLGLAWSAHARANSLRFAGLCVMPLGAAIVFLTYSRAAVLGVAVGFVVLALLARNRVTAVVQGLLGAGMSAAFVLVLREHREIADATGTGGAVAVLAALLVTTILVGLVGIATRRLDPVRVPPRIGRRLLAVAGASLVAAALVVGPGIASSAWSEFSQRSTTDTTDPVARLGTLSGYRYEIFASDLEAFRAHPLGGTGSGTFEFWFNRTGGVPQVRDGHSMLLEPMAELGVLGLGATLLFLGGLIAATLLAWRRARGPVEQAAAVGGATLLGVWIAQASVDWLWESPAVTILALAGASASAMLASGRPARAHARTLRVSLVLLSVAVVLLQVPGISSTRHLQASERSGKAGDLAQARSEARAAVAVAPWSSAAWGQLALVDDAAGRPRQAVAALGRAEQLEPTNWRWPFLRARALAVFGAADASVAALRRARELRPASPFLQDAG